MGTLNGKENKMPIAIVWSYKHYSSTELTRTKYVSFVKVDSSCSECSPDGKYHCFVHIHILGSCNLCHFKLIYNENDLFKEYINIETNEIVKVERV